jgi:hypothetical protein
VLSRYFAIDLSVDTGPVTAFLLRVGYNRSQGARRLRQEVDRGTKDSWASVRRPAGLQPRSLNLAPSALKNRPRKPLTKTGGGRTHKPRFPWRKTPPGALLKVRYLHRLSCSSHVLADIDSQNIEANSALLRMRSGDRNASRGSCFSVRSQDCSEHQRTVRCVA